MEINLKSEKHILYISILLLPLSTIFFAMLLMKIMLRTDKFSFLHTYKYIYLIFYVALLTHKRLMIHGFL